MISHFLIFFNFLIFIQQKSIYELKVFNLFFIFLNINLIYKSFFYLFN